MRFFSIRPCLYLPVFTLIVSASCAAVDIETSGFLRLVGGYLDAEPVEYARYDDGFSFNKHSLLGLQGQIQFSDELSLTALGLAHSSDRRDSGVEWFYLNYTLSDQWSFKLGQMQSPFYSLSDVLDVGFSYPWVIAPREVYSDFIFRNFKGVNVRYTREFGDYFVSGELYGGSAGSFNSNISFDDLEIEADIDNIYGAIGRIDVGHWQFRASYHTTRFALDQPEIIGIADAIREQGYPASADRILPQGDVDFLQLGVQYDSLEHIVLSEYTRTETSSDLFPVYNNYFISYGRVFDEVSVFITYSHIRSDLVAASDVPPLGESPILDILSSVYQSIYEARPVTDGESISALLRWDFSSNTAFKFEIKHIESTDPRSDTFVPSSPAGFNNKATLYLFGLDWVF